MTDITPPPIIVNASPTPEVLSTGIRYVLMAVSSIASAFGYTHLAGGASALVATSGTIASLIVMVWGLAHSHSSAVQKATMAAALPNAIAQTK